MGPIKAVVFERLPGESLGETVSQPWRKAILMAPPSSGEGFAGEPGHVVRVKGAGTILDMKRRRHGNILQIAAARVIPYHPDFSPSRIFLHLLRIKQSASCGCRTMAPPRHRYLLAHNTAGEFPRHPLHEDILALSCGFAEDYERSVSRGPVTWTETLGAIREYLFTYPRGRFRHQLEWRKVWLAKRPRDGERNVDSLLDAVQSCQRYLARNPKSPVKSEVKLKMARLLRQAHEAASRARGMGDTRRARRFFRRANHLYRSLLEHDNPRVRHTAAVALFNMENERSLEPGSSRPDW